MLHIPCPFCGPRDESEFAHGGPARQRRPDDLSPLEDAAWVDHLTVPPNPVGPVHEKWWHVRGCGQWVTIERNTLTHDILEETGK
ncbi:sarcosine oxidase subunit delta [Geminicoccaceae bacterium 1502E]|nr:sarcosine oxidase subunit delta [Geminicoccaceae bacterium 1502E]